MAGSELHPLIYERVLRAAFAEDLGRIGDITTDAVVSADARGEAAMIARMPGTVAGLGIARAAFQLYESALDIGLIAHDGDRVEAGSVLATVTGPARGILTGERIAVNLSGRLSGIATATRSVVDAVAGTGATVVCTRKTTPGLRALEKYAVRVGGGSNHRFGLDDAVLIKDNHIAIAGSITTALVRVRQSVGHLVKVEVEVDTLGQLEELLKLDADAVLLDNMDPELLAEAVAMVAGRMITEASGGITAETARVKAESGVDLLSVGWLTHSAPSLDIGLDVA